MNVRLISGNLELLLGRDFLYEFKIIIDSAATKIRIGDGKWISAVDNGKGLICLPIAPDPEGNEANPMTKAKRQRERKKRFKANQLKQVNRVSHKEQKCLENDENDVYLTEIRNLKNLVNDLGQDVRNMGIQSVSNSSGTDSAVAHNGKDHYDDDEGETYPTELNNISQNTSGKGQHSFDGNDDDLVVCCNVIEQERSGASATDNTKGVEAESPEHEVFNCDEC